MAKKKTEFVWDTKMSGNSNLISDSYTAIQNSAVSKDEYNRLRKHIELEQKIESRRRWNRRRRK